MARSKEQTDSFAKAVSGVVAVKRELARREKIVRDADVKRKKELRGAFRSTVHEFDSLEKGLRRLNPILGDIHIQPVPLQHADVPRELKNALIAVTRTVMHPDLRIDAQAKVAADNIRSLKLSFALSDVEKASLSLDVNTASEAIDLRFILSPVTSSDSQNEVEAFKNWIDVEKHGSKAFERRVVASRGLIRFVKSQVESRALTYIKEHTSA